MSDLKTRTLGAAGINDGGDPAITICDGHVDVKTFNKAFENEGWKPSDIEEGELIHGWVVETPKQTFLAVKSDKDAKAATYRFWD